MSIQEKEVSVEFRLNQFSCQWPLASEESWSIGIYQGTSPFALKPVETIENPVITRRDITDINASFVADPFIVFEKGKYYMFLEIKNIDTEKGDIGLATSDDGKNWVYQHVILEESYHLSYSYVFRHEGIYYMIPETLGAEAVRLYKAVDFPNKWKYVQDILKGTHADPSVFFHNGLWWMFTSPKPYEHNTLHLYFAETLTGTWKAHPQNPLIDNDASGARPAGRPIFYDGKWIRLAQDCSKYYGRQLKAFQINTLTPSLYQETELENSPLLTCSGKGWNGKGMHHMDALLCEDGTWLACVDGNYLNKGDSYD